MVKITYIGKRYRSLRARKGYRLGWNKGDTIDVKDEELLEELKTSRNFVKQTEIGKEAGSGGLKTHIRPPKRVGRPDKSRKHVDKSEQTPKEKVKCPKGSYKCKGVCKCDTVKKSRPQYRKKPKGLRKSKRAD